MSVIDKNPVSLKTKKNKNNNTAHRAKPKEPSSNIFYCQHCQEESPSRKRIFSSHAWVALLHWKEIDEKIIDKPICDYCYKELRTILMERADDIEKLKDVMLKNSKKKKTKELTGDF